MALATDLFNTSKVNVNLIIELLVILSETQKQFCNICITHFNPQKEQYKMCKMLINCIMMIFLEWFVFQFRLLCQHIWCCPDAYVSITILSVYSYLQGNKRNRSMVRVGSLANILSPVSSVKKVGQAIQVSDCKCLCLYTTVNPGGLKGGHNSENGTQ